MKRTLFVVVLTLVNIVAYCQVGVKNEGHYTVCTYDKAYLKSDNTGIISFEDFEVFHDKKTNEYRIKAFIREGTEYTFNLKYDKTVKEGSDVAYLYKGVRSNFMDESVVVFTRTKLSAYVKNVGFDSLDTIKDFDKQAISFIFPKTYLVFSVAPIKNTIEAHKAKEERIRQKEAARVAKGIAKKKLEDLLPYGEAFLKDSLQQQVIKEFFDNGRKVESSFTCVAVIDDNKQITIIRNGDDILDEKLEYEWLKGEVEYKFKNSKVVNVKVFFDISFAPIIEIQEHECSVRYDKKTNSYIYYEKPYRSNAFDESNQMEAPKEIRKIVEDNIVKKGKYSLYWKTVDEKLVSLSYVKHGLVDTVPIEVYSIYK